MKNNNPIPIETILYKELEGFKRLKIIGSDFVSYSFAKNSIKDLNDSMLDYKKGIYILYNEIDRVLYVGQSKNILNRIRKHATSREKDWFLRVAIFVSTDFDGSLLDFIEQQLITNFNSSSSWTVENKTNGNEVGVNISIFKKLKYDKIIETINNYILASEINIDQSSSEEISDTNQEELLFYYESKRLGTKGILKMVDDGFTLMPGSTFSKVEDVTDGLKRHGKNMLT